MALVPFGKAPFRIIYVMLYSAQHLEPFLLLMVTPLAFLFYLIFIKPGTSYVLTTLGWSRGGGVGGGGTEESVMTFMNNAW